MHEDELSSDRVPVGLRPTRGPVEYDDLVEVWRQAVVATHAFLTPEDIEDYRVRLGEQWLPAVELHVAVDVDDRPVGFLGMDGHRVEMLFVADRGRGRGVGTRLIEWAASRHPVLELDVNEQNPGALAFYESRGFRVVGRSPLDGEGRPFPLLHMRRNEQG
ncbi:acetyltransferase [Nocardiopsis alba]|uniref:acetyltransferase n=1 Tax=Nocardiopsis alba TaxID=53437 RepID=UPI0005A98C0D|nr:acetyltransferase [Nocardiopsis alba]